MSHEVQTMMFVGEKPWHGLGVGLKEAPASVLEALKVAGLDWEVTLQQLQLADGRKVDQFATVRGSDGAILGTVGAGYRPLQNAAAFSFFDPFVASGAAKIDTAGALRGGARVWMLAKIDRPDAVIVKKADDRVSKYLMVANGHDGHLSVTVTETPIRVVCQNTLSAALRDNSGIVNIRHTAKAGDTLKAVQEAIELADKDFEKAAEVYRALARRRITEAKVRAYIDAIFPRAKGGDDDEQKERKVANDIIEVLESGGRHKDLLLEGIKGTAWAAYNAVTEYLTWDRGRSADARLNNLWMGGRSNVGARALQAATATFLAS